MTMTPPAAPKKDHLRTHHGDTVADPYEWLREKDSPEVLEHLHAENAYTEAITAEQQQLREDIFAEIKHRTVETDLSVPARRGNYWYLTRTIKGQQHPVYSRVPVSDHSDSATAWTPPQIEPGVMLEGETTYFDTNAEAEQHPFYSLGGMSIDSAGNLLAYCEDTTGDERYTLRFKHLDTGENLNETVEDVHGAAVLDPTGTRAYYMVADASWRPHRLYMHTVGTPAEQDRLLLEITDEQLWTGVELSADKKELIIVSGNSEYDETRLLDVTTGDAEPVLLIPAHRRLLHAVDPIEIDGERLLLVTHNQHGPNNSLSVTTAAALAAQHAAQVEPGAAGGPPSESELDLGNEVLAHEDTVKFEGVQVTAAQVLVSARQNTVESVKLLSLDAIRTARVGGTPGLISELPGPAFEEELYTCAVVAARFEAPLFRVLYTSWLTPPRIYDIFHPSVNTGEAVGNNDAAAAAGQPLLRRETPVNDVDLSAYSATQIWAPVPGVAPDGGQVCVPITVMHHRDVTPDGSNPTVVYGYGSYEMSMDPFFGIPRLSLLDRGIVFAIAHVRGGGELGRWWYEQGKKLQKTNTFTDFVAATDHLVSEGWADPARIAAMGGSAGGLLMGAVANLAPEKYRAIVAQVPFVDNLTSILDPDLPLSALEWEEWGNPIEDAEVYEYMKSYSPYENVRDVAYPAIAAVTSLHDTRVLYVEPAKWVQRLREHQQGDAPVLLKIEMDGGHGGASGRYEQWKDRAWDYGFLAWWLGAVSPLNG